ncbi:hypothetical protein N0V90_001113 [Kalmusia sp. IMI 367209]|nr:hypothetical protein N0V90_001113 [Kalmusia sp. IMI 367209]
MRTSWPNFQVINGSLNFCNLVPVESEIVKACKRGDIIAVRDLFREHMASPNDISADDKSLLWIARLLIHSGADIEVLGDDGFTSAFFLFGYAGQNKVPQTEFLEILSSNFFSNFNGQDKDGWSVLHRVATFGTAADVRTLTQLKASVDSQTHNLHWTPIFCAVCFGNMGTLEELRRLYDDPSLKDRMDIRGWNFLHVAAGAGNSEAIPFLLEKGVDLKATSKARSRSIPPALRNKSVTPSEVAVEKAHITGGQKR